MIKRTIESIRERNLLRRRESLLNKLSFGGGQHEFFLVSFPKAGNTWLRVMIAYLLSDMEEIAFHNIGTIIPDTDQPEQLKIVTNRNSEFYKLPAQILKSHDYFSPYYHDKKVIYIVRDGVDCITSYYHFANSRVEIPFQHDAFIEGNTNKIKSWPKHLLSWHQANSDQLLLVKYEDIKVDAGKQLQRVAEFIGLNVQPEKILAAVMKSDFERMRQLEEKFGYYNDNRTTKGRNIPFVRQGKVGARSDIFTTSQINRFRQLSDKAAKIYGYNNDFE